ncbi:MAG: DUF4411 family protein [Candidatus Poribacteria bacterium]|nr:DUF4411 family protein [Candidatus Poribacteria bacterium]
MVYVFDTNSFRVLGNYYPAQFQTFWRQFNQAVTDGKIISVREVHKELETQIQPPLSDWVKKHKGIFMPPSAAETRFVTNIFSIRHFQKLVSAQSLLAGNPCADPFVIAKAEFIHGCVVTEEALKPNASKIPNVCEHFEIDCTNLQGFMEREGWTF